MNVFDDADTHDLLWTSGWDSTFRLLSALLLEGAVVQPHYVLDERRSSTRAELAAMDRIRAAIARLDGGAAERLLPTITAAVADLPAIDVTSQRYERLSARAPLGIQYEWLARYAAMAGLVDLELSIHRDDKAHVFLAGNVVPVRTRSTTVYRLASDLSDTDLALFERFAFPVLDLSKLDMLTRAADGGFLDVLELSWFCHSPVGDQPCGVCGPCSDAIREGVGHRLPPMSLLRHRVHRFVPWTRLMSRLAQRPQRAEPRPDATHAAS